jgi:hypothetical protein
MPYRDQEGLSIRVERLPFKARLSKGRNNGDNSWSLTLIDLEDLQYLPPDGMTDPHNLTIRVIRVDSDSASTLMRFDVPIGSGEIPQGGEPGRTETPPNTASQNGSATPAADVAAIDPPAGDHSRAPDRPVNGHAADQAAPPQNGHASAVPVPATGGEANFAQELERRLAEARASWEADHQGRVAAAVQEAVQKAETDARTQLDQSNQTHFAQEMEQRLAEARASWEADNQARVAAAVQEAAQKAESEARLEMEQATEVRLAMELERRLAEARASWDAELQGRIAVAVEEAGQQAGLGAAGQSEEANEAHIAQEVERRLAEARASWEADNQGRVAAAVQEAVQQTEADVRSQMDQANEARLAQELESRMSEARASWEAELQGRIAVAVEDAVRQAESGAAARQDQANEALVAQEVDRRLAEAQAQMDQTNDARLTQEIERRLSDARASWQAEQEAKLAGAVQEAVQKTQSEARMQLEQAQQEWRDASARELAEMSSRCSQAEVALAEARTQPAGGQEADNAIRGLRSELESAHALIRLRDTEMADMRHALNRAENGSGGAAEAEATIERNRAAWQAEREQLIAKSEEETQERIKQALEKYQNEAQTALTNAKQEWMEAEETRLAVAEAQWRENVGIAKKRAPLTPMAKRGRRLRSTGRLKRYGAIAACLAMAYLVYPKIEPTVKEEWWPKMVVTYKTDIEPFVSKATKDAKAWVDEMVKRGETIRNQKK